MLKTELDYVVEVRKVYEGLKATLKPFFASNDFFQKVEALLLSHEQMFAVLSPFQIGDNVYLKTAPEMDEKPGWRAYKDFLIVGAQATVKSVDWSRKHKNFYYYLSFHDIDDRSVVFGFVLSDLEPSIDEAI